MQLDQKTLNRLLAMNDEQLSNVVREIAREAGIDPALLGIDPKNIQSIRQALGAANDTDLQQLNEVYNAYRQNKRG